MAPKDLGSKDLEALGLASGQGFLALVGRPGEFVDVHPGPCPADMAEVTPSQALDQ